MQNVWVPNIVKKQVDVTVQKPQVTDEPYTYSVVVCKPETRTRTVNVCDYVSEQLSRDVSYTVCVPKQEEVTVNRPKMFEEPYNYTVTVCKPETRTRTVNVCSYVSEQLTRDVPYTVCVPKQQQVTVNRPQMFDEPYTYTRDGLQAGNAYPHGQCLRDGLRAGDSRRALHGVRAAEADANAQRYHLPRRAGREDRHLYGMRAVHGRARSSGTRLQTSAQDDPVPRAGGRGMLRSIDSYHLA